ncbi:fused DSP-PTPase phosphatase/NAD kinase-like protein [Streptomyces spiramyceticus]|uniref:fused DSP-PTPase phosphatase/NAD kinase-like protein n=1 Tax=Streptomyces spiramyceticus TaxID=299717 RepID=UPI00237C342A|nr:dual specificity protein phosphatase family protein [Streptomyces spiramyceticus]
MLLAPISPLSRTSPLIRRTAKIVIVSVLGYVALWLVSTLGMIGAHALASQKESSGIQMSGIKHFKAVDERLWRGSAPGEDGYRELAARGVKTVVDLRAEKMTAEQLAVPQKAGLKVVRMPIRDGQTPTNEQVAAFTNTVKTADGPVFVHCGAGVGRTGSITAAYAVRTGEATSMQAALNTLAVGPPSMEQVWYVLSSGKAEMTQPPAAVEAISRIFDAPRRIKASF